MRITLVFSPAATQVVETAVDLTEPANVEDALRASEWLSTWPQLHEVMQPVRVGGGALTVSIWGRQVNGQTALRNGDRIEFCRPLRVDPKVARRERFKKQGARNTGLFARQRPGAKPGY
jgi:putative ubiquitin-RnfH superfamily antitoxin RatB of RatAB toxin-antitoxin module